MYILTNMGREAAGWVLVGLLRGLLLLGGRLVLYLSIVIITITIMIIITTTIICVTTIVRTIINSIINSIIIILLLKGRLAPACLPPAGTLVIIKTREAGPIFPYRTFENWPD